MGNFLSLVNVLGTPCRATPGSSSEGVPLREVAIIPILSSRMNHTYTITGHTHSNHTNSNYTQIITIPPYTNEERTFR